MKRTFVATILALATEILLAPRVTGQGTLTLIGPSVLNGGFEDGVTSPWLGDAQAAQDPFFASRGSWYGVLQRSSAGGALRAMAWQYLTATPDNGRTFMASFDARVGQIDFDSISVDFFARSSDFVFTSATESPLAFPALSNSEWRTYKLQYLLPAGWTGDGEISLQILFHKADSIGGLAYTGYLDNVVLTQVPEPSALMLLALGGVLLMRGRRRHSKPCLSMSNLPSVFCGSIVLALPTSSSASGQITLIGPSTRNGSFEEGVATPWRNVQAANDPLFASDGSWYGVSQDTAPGQTARAGPNQYFSSSSNSQVNPDLGLTFILTFDARNGVVGFDTVSSSINAWNADGTSVLPSATLIASRPLGSADWAQYETVFQLPQTWDGGGDFLVGIQFTKHGALAGTTYTVYTDNFILTQIPEPSALALFGLGGVLLMRGRRRHSKP